MKKSLKEIIKNKLKEIWMGWEEGYGGTPGKDKAFVKGHRWTVKWKQENMKQNKLQKLIQECIGEVIKEKYIRGDEQHEDAEVALISQIRSLAQVAKMSGSAWKPADWSKWVQAIEKISDRLLKMHTTSKETPKLGLKHDIPLE